MADAEQPPQKRQKLPERDVQKMGWLTESTQQPRKHRFVEGVGVRGLPEMQAQLYKLEQEAAMKKAAGIPLAKPRRPAGPQLGKANAGVAERAERDRLQAPTEANRLAESEAALQRKAALYDRLARGEGTEAKEDMYHVDFLGKSASAPPDAEALTAAANPTGSRAGIGASHYSGNAAATDMHREQAHEQWVAESEQSYTAMSEEEERRQRRVDTVFELERETKRGRERAAEEKERRKELEDARRKQLKAAMLKQLATKLKASQTAVAKPA